jgi:hypothetical protein
VVIGRVPLERRTTLTVANGVRCRVAASLAHLYVGSMGSARTVRTLALIACALGAITLCCFRQN